MYVIEIELALTKTVFQSFFRQTWIIQLCFIFFLLFCDDNYFHYQLVNKMFPPVLFVC